jgi:hypothetical protein
MEWEHFDQGDHPSLLLRATSGAAQTASLIEYLDVSNRQLRRAPAHRKRTVADERSLLPGVKSFAC